MKKTILLFFLLAGLQFADAQTDEFQGCHHRHNMVDREPLTPEQRAGLIASRERSDTIDIVNYTISMGVVNPSMSFIDASCEVTFASKMNNIDYINLDLQSFVIDSIVSGGQTLTYTYNGVLLNVDLPTPLNIDDTTALTVYYHGSPVVDPTDFGGLDFVNGYAYNLGIGLGSNPYNYGRGWFPCFDNFVERSTYEFHIQSKGVNKAYCIGTFLGETLIAGDTILRSYRMDQQIPTYLAGIAVSNYGEVNGIHAGNFGNVQTQLIAKVGDTTAMKQTFVTLGDAIDALEYWYGPYQWERVGFVSTVVGAMEHPTSIAYPIGTGLGGLSSAHERLMSHELAHCWFGDYVTLSTEADMWFKEGNAEYGAHLMTEYSKGFDDFITQVKSNHRNQVLGSAHIDDGAYLQLSGIPFQNTYGTHTYNKGAAMIHNLRGYMQDSLFRVGQQSVLNNFAYGSLDGTEYRDQLMSATGLDLTSFFEDWIFNPGYSAFEFKYDYTNTGSGYEVNLTVNQKVHQAPHLHTNVPLEITCTDAAGNKYKERIFGTDQEVQISFISPVEPVMVTLNEDNTLNMAHTSQQELLDDTDIYNFFYGEMSIIVDEVPSPTLLHVDHYWVEPDPISFNPNNARLSTTHYWRVDGIFPQGFKAKGVLEYDAFFDSGLTINTEDSLTLLYRPNKNHDWREFPHFTKLIFSPTDGQGFVRIDSLYKGEYTFANGDVQVFSSNTNPKEHTNPISLFPNPASDKVVVQKSFEDTQGMIHLELVNAEGKVLLHQHVDVNGHELQLELPVNDLPVGLYWMRLQNEQGAMIGIEPLEVMR